MKKTLKFLAKQECFSGSLQEITDVPDFQILASIWVKQNQLVVEFLETQMSSW